MRFLIKKVLKNKFKAFFLLLIFSSLHSSAQIFNITHDKSVLACAFNPKKNSFATLSADKIIRIYDNETGKLIKLLNEPNNEGDVAICYSPDGSLLASGSWDKSIKIWDLSKGKVIKRLVGHKQAVRSIVFHPSGNFLASAGWDNEIKIWYVPTGINLKNLKGHNQCIRAIDFSPDGKLLASGGYDLHLKIWDFATGKELFSIKGHKFPIEALKFNPNGTQIATAGLDNIIRIWDPKTGTVTFSLEGHKEGVYSLDFSSDGNFLATGGNDNTLKIWNINQRKVTKVLLGHNKGIRTIAFNNDGKRLASGSIDNILKLWDISFLNISAQTAPANHQFTESKINTVWIEPKQKELMVFERNYTVIIRTEETSINKHQLFINAIENRFYNGNDTIVLQPKSIKKSADYFELTYDIYLNYGYNEIQYFGENIELGLYTFANPITLNCVDIEVQNKKSKLNGLIISPDNLAEKKWSYKSDNPEKLLGILKTQNGKTFHQVNLKSITKQEESTRDLILNELQVMSVASKPNDYTLYSLTGFFIKNNSGLIFYVSPAATIKTINDQLINLEEISSLLLKTQGFIGIFIDVSRKPKLIPEGYEMVTGYDMFSKIQTLLSSKKHAMIMVNDNPEPLKMYDQIANSFHISNDVDKNNVIDFQEVSFFIRNLISSQFYLRGDLFPVYLHTEKKDN